MNCPYCGKEIQQSQAHFCPHCGKKLDGVAFDHGEDKPESWTMPLTEPGWPAADASAPQTPPPAAPVTPPPEQPGQKRSGVLPTILILAVVALIVVGTVFVFRARWQAEHPAGVPSAAQQDAAREEEENTAEATAAPSQPAADTAEPTPVPTATPEPSATAIPLSELPGLEVQPDKGTDPSEAIVLRVTTQSSRLNMRSGPGTEYEVVGQADHGALVTKIGSLSGDQGWIVIECNGVFGWVSAQYLSPAE